MNSKVADYLKQARDQELIKRGFYTVKYYNNDDESVKNNKQNLKFDEKNYKYYGFVADTVTDEEYELIIKQGCIVSEDSKHKSALPRIYNALAIIVAIIGALAGLVICLNLSLGESSWIAAMSTWAATFFVVLFLVSIGKIISLLEQIRDK